MVVIVCQHQRMAMLWLPCSLCRTSSLVVLETEAPLAHQFHLLLVGWQGHWQACSSVVFEVLKLTQQCKRAQVKPLCKHVLYTLLLQEFAMDLVAFVLWEMFPFAVEIDVPSSPEHQPRLLLFCGPSLEVLPICL